MRCGQLEQSEGYRSFKPCSAPKPLGALHVTGRVAHDSYTGNAGYSASEAARAVLYAGG